MYRKVRALRPFFDPATLTMDINIAVAGSSDPLTDAITGHWLWAANLLSVTGWFGRHTAYHSPRLPWRRSIDISLTSITA
jgi:hypothetical protein